MDIDGNQARMAEFLRDSRDKVPARWCELAMTSSAAGGTPNDLRLELGDLYALTLRAMAEADESAAGELAAALAELSRSRARGGALPGETALSVFRLKDAVYERDRGSASSAKRSAQLGRTRAASAKGGLGVRPGGDLAASWSSRPTGDD